MSTQLVLPLFYKPDYTKDSFRPSHYCMQAYEWVLRWPNVTHLSALIGGEKGLGKTHLCSMWQEKTTAAWVTKNTVFDDLLPEKSYVIDDANEFIGKNNTEELLFHLFNHAKLHQKPILVTLNKPVVSYDFCFADLRSRLLELPCFYLEKPAQQELEILMIKRFHDLGIELEADVIAHLFCFIERTPHGIDEAIEKIVAILGEKKNVSKTLISQIFLKPTEETSV